ncbi:MAG: exodeoxyribonuclease I, partial [Shewanella sp.]
EKAHDALSDVYATIAMAKLIKEKQPKLYNYYFELRRKAAVSAQVDVLNMQPLAHVSSKISAQHGCTTLIAPVAHHPTNKNAVICVNLAMDLSPLFELDVEQIKTRMYTPRSELAEDEFPIPVKQIHINKCPFITSAKILDDTQAARLNIDKDFARAQYKRLKSHPELREKLAQLFESDAESTISDPDLMLYSGGFFSPADKAKMEIIRHTAPQNLAALALQFDDSRIPEMLFRYRARNYPELLDYQESLRWREFCQARLADQDYLLKLENLLQDTEANETKQKLLSALCHYLRDL